MSDAANGGDWGDLDQVPRKRLGPKLWFCGLGCLMPVLLLIVAGSWGYIQVRDGRDSELQWRRLEQLLPYDSRPEGWQMQFGFEVGLWLDLEVYVLTRAGEDGVAAVATILRQADLIDELFDPSAVSLWTPPGADQPLRGLEVQGRLLRIALVEGDDREVSWNFGTGPPMQDGENQLNLAIDLTSPDALHPIVLYWVHQDADTLTPDELVAFLAPFHIGPDR